MMETHTWPTIADGSEWRPEGLYAPNRQCQHPGGEPTLDDVFHSSALRLTTFLDGAIFPCTRAELLTCAEANEAPECVLNLIEHLPNKHYPSVRDMLPERHRSN